MTQPTSPDQATGSTLIDAYLGNPRAVAGLRHAVAANQVGHAYLITGPDQIGKRTLALAFAQMLQCQHRVDGGRAACGVCAHCRKVAHGTHPDVVTMSLPKDKQSYSIEQVRTLITEASLKPTEGSRRIFLVPDFELMTLPATQASLKVLEEPPPTAMILLTSVSTDLLLPTIRSRCQEVPLSPVATAELAAGLVRQGLAAQEEALGVAQLAGGLPGWAIAALTRPEELAERRALLDRLHALARASRAERITQAATFAADKASAQQTLALWLPWWRDVVLAAHGEGAIVRFTADRATIEAQARACGAVAAEAFVRALIRAMRELDQNANPRLVFDVLLLELPG